MDTLLHTVQQQVATALRKAFPDAEEALCVPDVSVSTQPQFGHYQCNNALKLGKALKTNPRAAAQQIVAALGDGKPLLKQIEIAGPGFINLTLDNVFLSQGIDQLLQDNHLGVPRLKKRERIIVEFSSPNIAKEMHVGHLRSTIIGDCLARVFEFLGYDVLRLNHVGDWGTQFGMLISFMKEVAPAVLIGKEKADLPTLMHWYKESKKRFDADPEFKKQAQLEVVKLQGGDPDSLRAWGMICEISRIAYQQIYDLLDVKIVERGESFYNPMLPGVIADLEKKGIITVSDGAKCIFLEGFVNREGEPLPMIVQKSDGGYNYDTTDLAAIRHRIEVEKVNRIIIATDAGQSLHFQMLFKAAEKAGYLDPSRVRVDHVPFGVVLGADGKKFKTRSGETEKLIDLLYEAVKQAKAILHERIPDLSSNQLDEMAKILGIDAVKYSDLSCHRTSDYVFSYERMLKFEGNTAAFMLYAYVRIEGIKRKVGKDPEAILKTGHVSVNHPSEIALAVHLLQFGEVLAVVADELLPNRLTDYLYTLAEKFHAFFRDCRVEGSPEETSRLLLSEATSRILRQGLHLLGLQVLTRM
jgi:arginyl-tRNA synthetase